MYGHAEKACTEQEEGTESKQVLFVRKCRTENKVG